tara:strand:- start:132 stop:1232 length:1101 start_codon:yes stop_codon:yes gene_type:complete
MPNELYITLTVDIEHGIEIVDKELLQRYTSGLYPAVKTKDDIANYPELINNFRRFFRVSRKSLNLDKQLLHIRKKYETLLKQSSDLIDYKLNFNTQFEGTNIYVVEFQSRRDLMTRLYPVASDKNRENIDDITFYFAKKNNLGQLEKLTKHNFNLFNLEIIGSIYSDPTLSELIRLRDLPKDDLFKEYNPGMPVKKVKLKFKIPIKEVVPSTALPENFSSNDSPRLHRDEDDNGTSLHPSQAYRDTASISALATAQKQNLSSLPENSSTKDGRRSHRDELGDREHPGRESRATAPISAQEVSPLVPLRSTEEIARLAGHDMRWSSPYDHLLAGKKKNRTKTKTKTRRRPTKTRKRKRKRKRNTKRR